MLLSQLNLQIYQGRIIREKYFVTKVNKFNKLLKIEGAAGMPIIFIQRFYKLARL